MEWFAHTFCPFTPYHEEKCSFLRRRGTPYRRCTVSPWALSSLLRESDSIHFNVHVQRLVDRFTRVCTREFLYGAPYTVVWRKELINFEGLYYAKWTCACTYIYTTCDANIRRGLCNGTKFYRTGHSVCRKWNLCFRRVRGGCLNAVLLTCKYVFSTKATFL